MVATSLMCQESELPDHALTSARRAYSPTRRMRAAPFRGRAAMEPPAPVKAGDSQRRRVGMDTELHGGSVRRAGAAVGCGGGLEAAGEAEFAQEVRHVHAGGLLADVEGSGDLRVGQAVAEQRDDFAFPWSQPRGSGSGGGVGAGTASSMRARWARVAISARSGAAASWQAAASASCSAAVASRRRRRAPRQAATVND
jgi:hypothetical protein